MSGRRRRRHITPHRTSLLLFRDFCHELVHVGLSYSFPPVCDHAAIPARPPWSRSYGVPCERGRASRFLNLVRQSISPGVDRARRAVNVTSRGQRWPPCRCSS